MKKRDLVQEYCDEWVRWSRTRTMYLRPTAGSTLGRLQPAKTGNEPNARNSPDMMYFNMAVHTLADMPKWANKFRAFKAYYLEDKDVVKRTADQLGLNTRTYYNHVKSFAQQAYRLAPSIKAAHEAMLPAAAPGCAPAVPASSPAPHAPRALY